MEKGSTDSGDGGFDLPGSSPIRWLVAIHRRLLPNRPEVGWTPYLWLIYLSFFLIPYYRKPPDWTTGAAVLGTLVIFLVLYFHGYWRGGRRVLWNIAAITILAIVWLPFNPASLVFFIYAAAFTGAVGSPREGFRTMVALSVIVALCAWVFDLPAFWLVLTLGISWVVAATNIYYSELTRKRADLRRSQEEVRRLATLAERERIARDLHDLLGHTLSVITMKAELARKLSERGSGERAAEEIAEVERISRDALRQVREAVEGYREVGLRGELARARIACEARQIALDARLERLNLEARAEAALAMVLREAVTNVARHSGASTCRVSLVIESERAVLRVVDDGRGGDVERMGSGLRGMRERLQELGGNLDIRGDEGWHLEARLPIASVGAAQTTAASAASAGARLATEEGSS